MYFNKDTEAQLRDPILEMLLASAKQKLELVAIPGPIYLEASALKPPTLNQLRAFSAFSAPNIPGIYRPALISLADIINHLRVSNSWLKLNSRTPLNLEKFQQFMPKKSKAQD